MGLLIAWAFKLLRVVCIKIVRLGYWQATH